MKPQKVITILILILGIPVLIQGLRISPYNFAWDPVLKQQNDNGILIAKVQFSYLLVSFGCGLYLAWKGNWYWMRAVYIAGLVVVVFKLMEMFSLGYY